MPAFCNLLKYIRHHSIIISYTNLKYLSQILTKQTERETSELNRLLTLLREKWKNSTKLVYYVKRRKTTAHASFCFVRKKVGIKSSTK